MPGLRPDFGADSGQDVGVVRLDQLRAEADHAPHFLLRAGGVARMAADESQATGLALRTYATGTATAKTARKTGAFCAFCMAMAIR